jgi:hypothetical protein
VSIDTDAVIDSLRHVIAQKHDAIEMVALKLADRPWWESSLIGALLGVLLGSLVTGVVTLRLQVAAEARARAGQHRDSLARLERRCIDYLNQIISNRNRAHEAQSAANIRSCGFRKI